MTFETAPSAPTRQQLLAVYAAAPFALMLILFDQAWQRGLWQETLSTSAASWPVYGLVFGVPHVLASFFSFGDKTLARACWPILRPALWRAALGTALVVPFMDTRWGPAIVIATTMVHVVGQQTGLAVGQARLFGVCAPVVIMGWRWTLSLAACATAVAIGGEALSPATDAPGLWLQGAGVLLAASFPFGTWLAWRGRSRQGDIRALLAMQGTAAIGWAAVILGYPLLGIWLFRCVHDVTAFMVYGGLANARERLQPRQNLFFKWTLPGVRQPGWWLWPLASVLMLILALAGTPYYVLLWITWVHYLAEHRLWRNGSPLRQHLSLR